MPNSNYSKTKIKILNLILLITSISNHNLPSCDGSLKFKNEERESILYTSEIIQPLVIVGHRNGDSLDQIEVPLSPEFGCPDSFRLHLRSFRDTFVIELVKNKRLISDRYFKIINQFPPKHHSTNKSSFSNHSTLEDGSFLDNNDDKFLKLHNYTKNEDHCHYHGIVNDNINSNSAISIVNNNLLSGFFYDSQEIYYLHADTSNLSTVVSKIASLSGDNSRLGTLSSIKNRSRESLTRMKRAPTTNTASENKPDNYIKHEPFQSNSDSLYVEMLIVHDQSQYLEYNKNESLIAERTMQIVNIMNAFYRQLNIFIALVGVVIWTKKDEIQLTNDGDSTLTNFLKYRHEKLLPKYHHDNAQLITSTSFNGSVVGKALKGPICTHEHSGGVNTDHSHSPAIVAVTLAHELGHNLGMEHDDDKCKCPDEKCIMSSSSSAVHPKHWSSCSIEHLEESRRHGLLECLAKKPEQLFRPVCGNGFIEEGEDCDLGELLPTFGTSRSRKQSARCVEGSCEPNQAILSNSCCDRRTCKFAANATCAQGPCCDLKRCSVYNGTETKVCRRRRSECDLEEVCDGKSEFCPEDVHYHDGIECGPGLLLSSEERAADPARTRAFCYNGHCKSHLSQCNLLWGSSGSVSRDICYEQNVHGNTSGNCGYDRMEKLYASCEPEDSLCGMLHCVHDQGDFLTSKKTGKLQYGFESASVLTVSFFVMSNHAKIYCNGAIIDSGPKVKDPGLVPDGASCGPERMCLNQKCVNLNEILYQDWCPSDCNGNGICDNRGVCHCFDGTIGTSCYQFFRANFHLSLLLYIVMFFVPLIALLVLAFKHYKSEIKIWWFLHNRHIELRNKQRQGHFQKAGRQAGYSSKARKTTISEPIPLNQHNLPLQPFYEQPTHQELNPWTETNVGGPAKT